MTSAENVLGMRDAEPVSDEERCDDEIQRASVRARPRTLGPGAGRKRPAPLSPEEQATILEEKKAKVATEREKAMRLVVGLDFGCTNSGLAYAISTNTPNDVEVISKWPGGSNVLEKCPSAVAYSAENSFAEDQYAFDVEPGMTTCQWFKLLLDKSAQISDFDDPQLQQYLGSGMFRLPANKTAVDVTADFLRHLYHHCLSCLKDMMGEIVDQTPIFWVLTLPASWSLSARQATLEAAQRAGFEDRHGDEIAMIDEPEAAATASIRDTIASFKTKQPFQPNVTACVVDMGGGTCDLSSYTIRKVEPLQLEEACVGEGGKVGGTTIDRNLHSFLQETFGHAFTELAVERTGPGSGMMRKFEEVKQKFQGVHVIEKVYPIPVKMMKRDTEDENVRKKYDAAFDEVKLSSKEIEEMFEPVLENTRKLIRRQIKRVKKARMPAITVLILCGGLGSSPYVKSKFQAFVDSELGGKVKLITPKRGWSAIARGAAMRGLDAKPAVLFRRARDAIGICVHKKFNDEVHDEEDAETCPLLGKRAMNQMEWLLKRGDKISPGMKKIIKCYVVIPKEDFGTTIMRYQDLWACTSNEPPSRLEENVVKVGRVAMNLTSLVSDESKRYKKANDGASPTQIDCDIRIELSVGSFKGVLQVTAKAGTRKVVGDAQIEYVADPAWKGKYIEE